MPATSTAKHPVLSDLTIRFTESDHSYIDSAGLRYTSATTIIKGAFLPFDAPKMAEGVAKREGGTVAEVLATWEMKRMASSDFGTRFHSNMEATIKGLPRPCPPKNEKEILAFRVGVETAKKLMTRYGANIWAEKIVFSPFYKVSGTLDLIASDGGLNYYIFDWKTNEQIKRSNTFQSCAIQGLEHLEDCDFVRYGLQLSLYERVLRREGYIPSAANVKRIIIHIAPEAEKPEFIEASDLKREVAEILLENTMIEKTGRTT